MGGGRGGRLWMVWWAEDEVARCGWCGGLRMEWQAVDGLVGRGWSGRMWMGWWAEDGVAGCGWCGVLRMEWQAVDGVVC